MEFNTPLVFLIISIMAVLSEKPKPNQEVYTNTPLKKTPAIFENIGRTVFYEDTWNIVTKFTPMDVTQILIIAQTGCSKIRQVCTQGGKSNIKNFERDCLVTEAIGNLILAIGETNKHIKEDFRRTRTKRALEFVGGFNKWAFGMMDAEDSRKVYHKIKTLETRDEKTINLIQHQLTIMQSNLESVANPIINIIHDLNHITKNLNEFGENMATMVSKTNKDIANLNIQNEVNRYSTLITLKLMEVQQKQFTELSILNDLYNNNLHPFLLDFQDINDILETSWKTKHASEFYNNMGVLHQAVTIEVFKDEPSLIIKIEIPIPKQSEYDMYKIYLIPTTFKRDWDLLIKINYEYVAETANQDSIVPLTKEEYNNCKKLTGHTNEKIRICNYDNPILKEESHKCVTDLLQSSPSSKTSCKYHAVPTTEGIITKMKSSNKWLYNLKSPMKLNIICENDRGNVELTGLGTLVIHQPCQVENRELRLPVERTTRYNFEIKETQMDHSKILEELTKNITLENPIAEVVQPKKIVLEVGNGDDITANLMKESKSIKELRTEVEKEIETRNHSTEFEAHRYSLGTIAIVVIVIIVVMIIFWVQQKGKENGKNVIQVTNITKTDPTAETSGMELQDINNLAEYAAAGREQQKKKMAFYR